MRSLCLAKNIHRLSPPTGCGSHRRPLLLLSLSRGSHTLSRRHEEESRGVRVSVWWDFENCNVPLGINVFSVVHTITAAIRTNGIKGPIEITAFGDMLQLSRARQEGLSATGVNLTHIPNGGKNSADRSLLLSLMFWVSQNPPPAHLLLISGDRDFASTLHRLRMSNYNILLATPETAPGVLCSAASIMWNWHDLLRGENLMGKYFNQPPDGPYGSWYGYYKVPLEDPFSNVNQQACLQSEVLKAHPVPREVVKQIHKTDPSSYVDQQACLQSEESSVPKSSAKLGNVPKAVVKQIRKILEENPKGISINDLRLELIKTLTLDREYYGYRKFLPFLLSLENILKIRLCNGIHYILPRISQYYHVVSENNSGTATAKGLSDECEDGDVNAASEFNFDNESVQDSADSGMSKLFGKLTSSPSNLNANDRLGNTEKTSALEKSMIKTAKASDCHFPSRDVKIFETVIVDEKIAKTVDAPESENQSPRGDENIVDESASVPESDNQSPRGDENIVESVSVPESDSPDAVLVKQDSSPKDGFFRKFWRKWFGSKISGSDNKSSEDEEKCQGKDLEMDSKSRVGNVDSVLSSSQSSSNSESAQENKTSTSSAVSADKPVNPGFIHRIQNLCKLSNATSGSDELSDVSSDRANQKIKDAGHELFLKDSFWSSMESFLNTSQGSLLVTKSTTRETMACNFQSKGPACLQSLGENDLLRLVDLLISEKKWVEESRSEVFPFKLTWVEKSLSSESHHGSNGLSSIFLSSTSQPCARILANHNIKGKSGNVSHDVEVKLPVRSRDEVLADCQNLVNEILKEHPEGFFVGLFRKHFLERYGYHLDLHQLGFPKLAALLRTMSCLKIESGYIIPCDNNPPDNNPPKTARVEDISLYEQENDSHTAASDIQLSDVPKNDDSLDSLWDELGPVAPQKSVEKETDNEFEPAMSDDDFSDSVETSPTGRGGHSKAQMEEKRGSLLQILDSWHTRKESDSCKAPLANADLVPDTAKLSTGLSLSETMREMPSRMHGRKQRFQKTYLFVSDSGSDDNNAILGNLRNPPNESSKKAKDKVLCE